MSDRANLTVKCSECGDATSLTDVDADKVRYFFADGRCARFGSVTQALLDSAEFYCECCQDDRNEMNDND